MIGKRLRFGDTIGLISPASPENIEAIKKAILFLNNIGFNVIEGKHLYDRWGYLAGRDKDRASDIMEMFENKAVDMILCVRGGYGSSRLLPYLDYDIIKKNPKIFAGFSDITVFLNTFYEKCGLTTFHSPMGTSNLEDVVTFKSFMFTFMEGYKPYTIKNPDEFKTSCINPGIAKGNLIGGNLGLICNSLGTPYEIDMKDKILFIEEVNEAPYRVDRILTQFLLSNKLKQCKGIILGQFKDCDLPHYERSLTLEEVLEDRLYNLDIPMFSGFCSGHDYPKLTIPIGARVRMDAELGIINVLDAVVE
ncbi:S66 peptidase family protein [Clostridium estertheticum]|uniref:S66 peptidase family protein n=1 Tax=Clostridium estertheticum TaxID=238834 RepID=UPI001C7CA56A|nr:LD-carboxypeptidase [Clostridium estertheticum]MBX4267715.1 LD-carboxypeptidase [Clostridium estertheticum]WLC77961.1 LD-carboxypeptidase [Clostridium estertheticum]